MHNYTIGFLRRFFYFLQPSISFQKSNCVAVRNSSMLAETIYNFSHTTSPAHVRFGDQTLQAETLFLWLPLHLQLRVFALNEHRFSGRKTFHLTAAIRKFNATETVISIHAP